MKVKVLVELEMSQDQAGSLGLHTKKEMVEHFASCIIGNDFESVEILYPVRNGSVNPQESY